MDQRILRIEHFASSKYMDIRGLGGETITAMVKHGLLSTPADIYRLRLVGVNSLVLLPRMSAKIVDKLLKAIEASRTPELWRLIAALGIRGVSDETAKSLAKHYLTYPAFLEAKLADLLTIKPVGEKTAQWTVQALATDGGWMVQ